MFKENEVCENLHPLQAELSSGFGDIKDAIVLGAAKHLKSALGEFEEYEYSLANKYADYLKKTLFGAHRVNSEKELNDAIFTIIDTEENLNNELRELIKFKRSIPKATLYR